jgi:hypothetical protein
MNDDFDDTTVNISLQGLKELLLEKQHKVNELTNDSKNNASELKKINKTIDDQQKLLINVMIKISDSLVDIDNLDRYTNDEEDFSTKIEEVEQNMRKIKGSLANLIKYG